MSSQSSTARAKAPANARGHRRLSYGSKWALSSWESSRFTVGADVRRWRRHLYLWAGLAMVALSACNSTGSLNFPGVYKISIAQGNIITQDMIDQLRPGLTRSQVAFVMGTPLIRDPFHQDRWDYVYNFQPGGGVRGQERVAIFFRDGLLERIEGDFTPVAAASPDTTE